MVGTTWYERGFSYWLRRAGGTLFITAFLAMWTGLIGSFVRASGPVGSPAFIGVLTAEVVYSLAIAGWIFYRAWRPSSSSSHRWTPSFRTVNIATKVGSLFLIFLWGIGVLLSYGLFLALFILSFAPVPPPEREARQIMASRLHPNRYRIKPPGRTGAHAAGHQQGRRGRKR